MKDQVRHTLATLKEDFGDEIFTNSARFRGAISDVPIAAYEKRIRHLLKLAICDMRAYNRLETSKAYETSLAMQNLITEMSVDYDIKKDAAKIVIECIAELLGIVPVVRKSPPKSTLILEKGENLNLKPPMSTDSLPPPPASLAGTSSAPAAVIPLQSVRTKKGAVIRVGDVFPLGGYTWQIVKLNYDYSALIISKTIISKLAYHNRKAEITWETCDLRKYLNNDFYKEFSAKEQSRILATHLKNPNNKKHNIPGGNDTTDKIFLLSIDEAHSYFKTDGHRVAKFEGSPIWWWLRTPGEHKDHTAYVHPEGNINFSGAASAYIHGKVYGGGFLGYRIGGVRPALMVNLEEALVTRERILEI